MEKINSVGENIEDVQQHDSKRLFLIDAKAQALQIKIAHLLEDQFAQHLSEDDMAAKALLLQYMPTILVLYKDLHEGNKQAKLFP